ncbi:MAG: 3-ketoacyl-CoA thiolase with broad chain length specificity [Claussenomyces sp. TS43310]|nr:MAG: 3-ketoacyl-CoA thiolase with broad chain length specificity [Claussenomyces sp. TS43310]
MESDKRSPSAAIRFVATQPVQNPFVSGDRRADGRRPVAQSRLTQVSGHLAGSESIITPTEGGSLSAGRAKLLEKSPDDIVVTACLRTAFTRGGKGGFKDTAAADLLVGAFKSLIERSSIDPALVEDIAVGSVLPPGGGATEFRAAALAAGFPDSAAVRSVNRQCSSGLQACVDIANAIQSGMIEVGIGAGVESMSLQYGPGAVTEFSELLDSHPEAKSCKVPMGVLSEQMAKDKGISREVQDAFAASSYQKALKAQEAGLFDEEIAPLTVKWEDPKTGDIQDLTVAKDDGIRPGITAASLGKIKPAFAKDGSIHAGNASQISDGAAAVLLMKRATAQRLGQPILGRYVAASVVGVAPLLMGIGPWKAIPRVLARAGLAPADVDIFEINEAFASQCCWCARELGLDPARINPKGGAIAFGHPLGCTGARQVSTLLYELRRRRQSVGVTSMCVGTGMGMAAVWVAE